jgi:hypothetical protein
MNKSYATNDEYIYKLLNDPHYLIDYDGIIFSLFSKQGHILKDWREVRLRKCRDGSIGFGYGPKNNRKLLKRSRIMYARFVGNLESHLKVKHKDGNVNNDNPNNLELVTQSNINTHRFQTLKHPPVKGNRKLSDSDIIQIRSLQSLGWSNKALREHFNTCKSNISYIVNNKTFKDI